MISGKIKFRSPWVFSTVLHITVLVSIMIFSSVSFKKYYPAKVHKVNLIRNLPVVSELERPVIKKEEPKKAKKRISAPGKKAESKKMKKVPVAAKERESLKQQLEEKLLPARKTVKKHEEPKATAVIQGDRFPYTWYDSLILNKISGQWKQPSSALLQKDVLAAVVSFAIMKDGGIEGLLLSEKSGYAPLDSSVIIAVRDSAPLPPLPKEFGESLRQVNVRFELKR